MHTAEVDATNLPVLRDADGTLMATTLTRQRETHHEVTIPMPKVTPTASPLPPIQLSEQTLVWLAERPHALRHIRSIWDTLAR